MALVSSIAIALHVVYSKYTLNQAFHGVSLIIPITAGIIFGYLVAYVRNGHQPLDIEGSAEIYLRYIGAACVVMTALNIIHAEFVIHIDLEPVLFLAPLLAGVFVGYLTARVRVLSNRLLKLSSTDLLTKTYTRKTIDTILNAEIDRANRYGGRFSVIYCRVEHFADMILKSSHAEVDRALTVIAKVVRENNRSSDLLARYAEDSFLIAAMQTGIDGAEKHAQRIKSGIDNLQIEQIGKVTCSFGVTEFIRGKDDVPSLIHCAHEAVAQAEQNGGGCVIISQARETDPPGSPRNSQGRRNHTAELVPSID